MKKITALFLLLFVLTSCIGDNTNNEETLKNNTESTGATLPGGLGEPNTPQSGTR